MTEVVAWPQVPFEPGVWLRKRGLRGQSADFLVKRRVISYLILLNQVRMIWVFVGWVCRIYTGLFQAGLFQAGSVPPLGAHLFFRVSSGAVCPVFLRVLDLPRRALPSSFSLLVLPLFLPIGSGPPKNPWPQWYKGPVQDLPGPIVYQPRHPEKGQ